MLIEIPDINQSFTIPWNSKLIEIALSIPKQNVSYNILSDGTWEISLRNLLFSINIPDIVNLQNELIQELVVRYKDNKVSIYEKYEHSLSEILSIEFQDPNVSITLLDFPPITVTYEQIKNMFKDIYYNVLQDKVESLASMLIPYMKVLYDQYYPKLVSFIYNYKDVIDSMLDKIKANPTLRSIYENDIKELMQDNTIRSIVPSISGYSGMAGRYRKYNTHKSSHQFMTNSKFRGKYQHISSLYK